MSYDKPVSARVDEAFEKYTTARDVSDAAALDTARQALANAMAEQTKVSLGMITSTQSILFSFKKTDPALFTLYKEECAKILTLTEFFDFDQQINKLHGTGEKIQDQPSTKVTDNGKQLGGGGLPNQANAHHGTFRF